MAYHAPRTVEDAVGALTEPGARILAGGTDFYPALGERPVDFTVIDIGRIDALRTIAIGPEGVRIGATATWSDVIAAPLSPAFDGLKAAAREVGAAQIQNTGTIAGNLCNASPAADGVPPLLALDASVEVTGRWGARTIALADFITGARCTALGPAEMVTAIIVPAPPDGAAGAFIKLGARRYLVISIAMVAVVIAVQDGTVSHAAVAVGACSAVAQRLSALEAALQGVPVADAAARVRAEHLSALSPISDVRADAPYRSEAALELVRRTIDSALRSFP